MPGVGPQVHFGRTECHEIENQLTNEKGERMTTNNVLGWGSYTMRMYMSSVTDSYVNVKSFPRNLLQKLEQVGTRSGMECTHDKHDKIDHVFPIVLRRRGFRERVPAAKFNGLLFDEM